jgi:hypothetical protein
MEYQPEKVVLAEDLIVLREALVTERRPTVGTLETVRVPRPLHDLKYEAVKDGQATSRTVGNDP